MVAIVDFVGLTQDLQGEFQSRLNASPAHHISGRFSIEMKAQIDTLRFPWIGY
jgi:hypothetical protein